MLSEEELSIIKEASTESHTDRRRFSDADIKALCDVLDERVRSHYCRFSGIDPEKLRRVINFSEHTESLMSEAGATIRKTVLAVGVVGLLSLLVIGLYVKLKNFVDGVSYIPK